MQKHCKKCGHVWNYKGKSIYYFTCPQCYNKIRIPPYQKKTKEEEAIKEIENEIEQETKQEKMEEFYITEEEYKRRYGM